MKNCKFIGWDIGGAHTKVSVIYRNRIKTRVFNLELWYPDSMHKLKLLINDKKLFSSDSIHCITLSGEMCDIFSSRIDGLNKIFSLFKSISSRVYVFTKNRIIKLSKLNNLNNISSMNWYPIGLLLRDKIDQCIAVDIGSTTTDFILIKANKIINKRIDDLSGLNTNELLYLGCLRSPLYAVSKNINCSEKIFNVIPENFSSLADVYQLLEVIDARNDYTVRADKRDKRLLYCYKRISRSLGFDYTKNHKKLI